MIVKGDSSIRRVTIIDEKEEKDIRNFLQGAVYCWCKNRRDEPFSLRDLMGGENFEWSGTPLYILYEKEVEKGQENPVLEAGKACGWILKSVINDDNRKFETFEEEMIRKYLWIEECQC